MTFRIIKAFDTLEAIFMKTDAFLKRDWILKGKLHRTNTSWLPAYIGTFRSQAQCKEFKTMSK